MRQPAYLQALMLLRDGPGELVFEEGAGAAYIGHRRFAPITLHMLNGMMAIHLDQYSKMGEFERYSINETGLEILKAAGL